MILAVTQSILKLGPPDLVLQQIQIVPRDDVDDYGDDNDYGDSDDDYNDDAESYIDLTRSFLQLRPPNFTWQQTKTIPTESDDDDDDNDYDNADIHLYPCSFPG